MIFAFHRGILFLFERWSIADYSHAWIIPPLTILIAFSRLEGQTAVPKGTAWGVPVVAMAFPLLLVGELAGMFLLIAYGLLFATVGMIWTAIGTSGIWRIRAALLYLLFAMPIPGTLYGSLSLKMQLWSSELAVFVMQALGISVFLQGNLIDLGSIQLEVEEACNGLRYLFPLVSFGFLAAVLMEDRFWKRAVLVASTLPITLVVNSLRIALIGVLVDNYGIGLAQGTHHLIEGFVIFGICVVILLGEVWLLLRIGPRGKFAPIAMLTPDASRFGALVGWRGTGAFRAAFGVVAVGTVAIALIAPQSNVEQTPDRRPLDVFPMRVADWVGRAERLGPDLIEILRVSEYLLADYRRDGDPAGVNFFVSYYASQREGIAPHNPQYCIPGDGWRITSLDTRQMPADVAQAGGPEVVNRVLIERRGVEQVVYYWFDQRGRQLANEHTLKFFLLWDILTRGRSDGALVRLVSPILQGETSDDAEARMIDFIGDTLPLMPGYLPH